jgi:hypothetical protein
MSVLQACPEPVEGFHFMLRAAALLPLLRELQRFDTIGHPTASVACYLEPDLSQNWTFTSEQTMTFQDTPRCVGQFYALKNSTQTNLDFYIVQNTNE